MAERRAHCRTRGTPATAVLKHVLPVEGTAKTWGEEVYFSIPVSVDPEGDARQVVDPGTVCFWVDGGEKVRVEHAD